MKLSIAVYLAALTFCVVHANQYCGRTPVNWLNQNITCPARAVCADVFNQVRDWYNGTRCEETRVLHNCLCPGNTVCPFNDNAHMLHASAKQKIYTCEPVCQLPWCPGVSQGPQHDDRRLAAVTTQQNAREFRNRSYYRMECRCPRHQVPFTERPRARAVRVIGYEYDPIQGRYITLYACRNYGGEGQISDACAAK